MTAAAASRPVQLIWGSYDPNKPAGCINIGRGSPWGNPFQIGPDGNRDEVLYKFRLWLRANPKLVAKARQALRGLPLACPGNCVPLPCHGEVWDQVVNQGLEP
jgi:hypothetical protein